MDLKSEMESFFKGVEKVAECKTKMIDLKLMKAKAHCPVCNGKNTLIISLAPQRRDPRGYHARWYCKCGFGGME